MAQAQLPGTLIDHGFHRITAQHATRLCEPYGLPRAGYERAVVVEGIPCWIARTHIIETTYNSAGVRDGWERVEVWSVRRRA